MHHGNSTSGMFVPCLCHSFVLSCASRSSASSFQGDHNEHAARFVNSRKSNYFNATLQGLITIGLDRETVRKRVKEISVQAEPLEVIGLVVSAAHDTYEMYVRPKLSEEKLQGPFFFVCDCVAKKLQPDEAIRENCVVTAVELHKLKKRKSTDD